LSRGKLNKNDIVGLFKENGNFLSGSDIASHLGVTRAAVWKSIRLLKKDGYVIESMPAKGYRLNRSPDLCIPELIKLLPQATIIGNKLLFFASVSSTNAVAMEMASQGCPEGTIVMAETQTAGKGRLGRSWISPPGKNLYISIVLRPAISPRDATALTLLSAVACISAIRQSYSVAATIKWPNDIIVENRKLGGILTEIKADIDRITHAVVGIGINVNLTRADMPDEIKAIATSIIDQTGELSSRTDLAAAVIREFDKWYGLLMNKGKQVVIDEWLSLSSTIGKHVMVATGRALLEGYAEGIDDEGLLILKLADGTYHKVSAGDVTLARTRV
jgi:BirA family transcriptional regulator, biotin operon repressor / biotin---[acetyl-CoA-carboxylase] ligase